MEPNLDEQIKAAERDKYLAEAKKVEAEKERINFQHEQEKKESLKPWWKSLGFRQILIGTTALGFYITYVIIPAFNIENIQLKLENQKGLKKLAAGE